MVKNAEKQNQIYKKLQFSKIPKNCNFFFSTHWQTKKRVHKQSICSYNFFLDLKHSIFSIVYLIELIRFGCQMDTTTHALPESLVEVLRRHLGLSLGWSQFREKEREKKIGFVSFVKNKIV